MFAMDLAYLCVAEIKATRENIIYIYVCYEFSQFMCGRA